MHRGTANDESKALFEQKDGRHHNQQQLAYYCAQTLILSVPFILSKQAHLNRLDIRDAGVQG